MAECGKGCMPECRYFTTGGCISPFNCMYKIERESITTSTSTPLNPDVTHVTDTYKDNEIARLQAENAVLRAVGKSGRVAVQSGRCGAFYTDL